ncbi:MAG: ABC transporter substrate-binding protein [Spirochaetaceae bacterium]|nr:ABC transporter substrate-binding protein [Spirochaetaceae bacterium]
MNRARTLLILATLCALAAAPLFATGEEETSTASAAADNPWTDGQDLSGSTVNVFGAFVDVDAERFDASMAPFEEQTGIDIVYEGSGDFESLVVIRAEGGDPPDIAAFPQPGLMADMVRRGFIVDLSESFSMDYLQQQYSDAWIDLSRVDDTIAGVWYRASLKSLVWYAKPVFEAEGYEIPETWDELVALSEQMVADGHVPWSIGIESSGATGWVATDWIEDILLRTATPEQYDAWTRGELPFDSPEVRRAVEIMGDIWFRDDFVLGGRSAILTVPFGDAATPLVTDPPRALMHRQATFIAGFLPESAQEQIGDVIDVFYLPPIDDEEGRPALGAGDILSAFNDDPATLAVMRWLASGESTRVWAGFGGFVAPHKDAKIEWHGSYVDQKAAEIIQNADTFRFDGSDLMPGAVGAGTFWTGMVDYISGEELGSVLAKIDASFPR